MKRILSITFSYIQKLINENKHTITSKLSNYHRISSYVNILQLLHHLKKYIYKKKIKCFFFFRIILLSGIFTSEKKLLQ